MVGIHGAKIGRMHSSLRYGVAGRLPCFGEASLSLRRAGFWWWRCRQVQLLTCALIFASGAMGWLRVSRPFVLPTSGSWQRAPSTESATSVGSGPVAASSRWGFEDGGGPKSRSRRKNRSVCACRACTRRMPVAIARRPGRVIVGAEPHCAAAFGVVRGNPTEGGTPEPPAERNLKKLEQTLTHGLQTLNHFGQP
jgi:hypothetical protein